VALSNVTMIDQRAFRRIDESTDAAFYSQPRFVEHIDATAIAAVTQLYREYFPPDSMLLRPDE
jgi:hypothetical protein